MSSTYITEPATSGKVCIKTTVGDIDVELWTHECPLACRNFIQLCMENYYDNVIFHRLIKDFIVQTGDPSGTGEGGDSIYGGFFKSEYHQRLKFVRRGLVGMAGEQSQNNSQFFFTLAATPELDKKHTLFGKVVGETVFNMIKLNDSDVDKNNRPERINRIISTKVLLNPFKNIKPRNERKRTDGQLEKQQEKKKKKSEATLKSNLLSFGDEVFDDEEAEIPIKKFKSKSSHDVLEDALLSKERAVKTDEIGESINYENEETDDEERQIKTERLNRIKEKMKSAKRHTSVKFNDDTNGAKNSIAEEDNLECVMLEQQCSEKQEKLNELTQEVKSLQKEFNKTYRKKKEDVVPKEEKPLSEAMQFYKKLKLNCKSSSDKVRVSSDKKREDQSQGLIERFKIKIERASMTGILMDKKVDMSDQKSRDEIITAEFTDRKKIKNVIDEEEDEKIDDEEADDNSNEWMLHKLVGFENVRKEARDANLKDMDKEWYPIDDPRNFMNVRRREEDDIIS